MLGTSEQIVCGWTTDLLPHPCSSEIGKYTKYSSNFRTFGCVKISRRQHLPTYSEFP